MCFHRERYWEEGAAERHDRRLWDLFYRETEQAEPPAPVAEHEERHESERDPDEAPVGAER